MSSWHLLQGTSRFFLIVSINLESVKPAGLEDAAVSIILLFLPEWPILRYNHSERPPMTSITNRPITLQGTGVESWSMNEKYWTAYWLACFHV